MASDFVLAGPFLRRVTTTMATLWLATSAKVDLAVSFTAEAKSGPGRQKLAIAVDVDQQWLSIGSHIHICLLQARLRAPRSWPSDSNIAYELQVIDDAKLSDALGRKLKSLALQKRSSPFFHPIGNPDADSWVASCRKLGSPGSDAFMGMAKRLQNGKAQDWPRQLMLCGDQIYADEVSDEISEMLATVHAMLFGKQKYPGDRTSIVLGLGFSADEPSNHLLTFSEWVCCYLLSWSASLNAAVASPKGEARVEAAAAETVMAHVPTYMMFDDHEVTDDWNIDADWRAGVAKKGGAAVIEAALLAYFIFQHWGNVPQEFDRKFLKKVQDAIDAKLGGDGKLIGLFDGFMWSYAIEGPVASLVLDCRTNRAVDNDVVWLNALIVDAALACRFTRDKSLLCRPEELQRARGILGGSVDKLVLYLSTPLFSFPTQEVVQSLSARFSRYFDPESWDAYPRSWTLLSEHLLRPLGVSSLIIVAGDVHYSFAAEGQLSSGGWNCNCFQLTSSPCKNRHSFVPNYLFATTWSDRWIGAAWLEKGRYLTTATLPDELRYRVIIQAAAGFGSQLHMKTWRLRTASRLHNRPEDANSFAAFALKGSSVHYAIFSAESSALLLGSVSLT